MSGFTVILIKLIFLYKFKNHNAKSIGGRSARGGGRFRGYTGLDRLGLFHEDRKDNNRIKHLMQRKVNFHVKIQLWLQCNINLKYSQIQIPRNSSPANF